MNSTWFIYECKQKRIQHCRFELALQWRLRNAVVEMTINLKSLYGADHAICITNTWSKTDHSLFTSFSNPQGI
jgi:hypothetical protein